MKTRDIEERMVALERRWFAADKEAAAARADVENAARVNRAELISEASIRLQEAQQHKSDIMRDIEALEDSLLG